LAAKPAAPSGARALEAVRIGAIKVLAGLHRVSVPLDCPRANLPAPCQGKLKLVLHVSSRASRRTSRAAGRAHTLATVSYRVGAGASRTLTLSLRASAAQLLGQAGRWSTLEVVVTSRKGATSRRSTLTRSARSLSPGS
jgi:hypothetical protein